jgi:membrane protein
MKVLNQVFDAKENRPLLRRYGVAVGLTAVAGLFVMASAVIVVAGQASGREIVEQAGLEGAWVGMVLIARFALICVLLLTAVAFVFWAAPAGKMPFRWLSAGAAVFVLLWLAFTSLFSLYVANLGSYNATYGALGSVVILLVWIYLSSFLFLIGAEVNAILARKQTPAGLAEREPRHRSGAFGRLRRVVSAGFGAAGRLVGAAAALGSAAGRALARKRPRATRPS